MRIAIATAKLDPRHGGAESWTIGLANWLTNRGRDVHLVGLKATPNLRFASQNVHLLDSNRNRMQVAHQLSEWLKSQRFDIIHDMGLGYHFDIFQQHCGSLAALEQGKHESLSMSQRIAKAIASPFATRKRSIENLASIQFLQRNASYIAVSQMVSEDLQRLEAIPASQIRTIPNGVSMTRFDPKQCGLIRDSIRAKLAVREDALVVSVIAHNHQLKGVSQMLSAIRMAHDFPTKIHLLVVGGHRQAFRRFDIGNHSVTYTGSVQNTLEFFAATDVYLHPTFYDACCLSVLEAMACGIPTITTRVNGAAERIVHGRNGFLLESPKDTQRMVNLLRDLTDPAKRSTIGCAARETAETWTVEDNYLAVESLYCEHMARSQPNQSRLGREPTRSAA